MAEPAGSHRLGDYSADARILVLSAAALLIGGIAAVVAKGLLWLIDAITNLAYFGRLAAIPVAPGQNQLGAWSVFVPVAGGLAIGAMARWGSPKIRGHGIPEALEAILIGRSRLDARVAILKPVSSAISIGTGGPFGAEGPIIMTGGAFGSLFAQLFHFSSAERKTLLVAGAAAGMSAVFASPIAATLLAVELLLFEWKPRSFIPVALAAALAAVARGPLIGPGPVFPVPPHAGLTGPLLVAALGLGVAAGLASGLLTAVVYGCEDLFQKLPIHWMWWPALGGLCVGVGGLFDPRILGVGYGTIHALLRGEVSGGAAASLVADKGIVWAVALGSGTSGGVLAPLLMMGGALGSLFSSALSHGDAGLWATIGMAAMMGGTMRSPLTAMFFAGELTHDWGLLPGLLVACVAAYAVTVLLLKRSILTEKIARRGHHVFREYAVDPFDIHRIGEVMDREVPTVPTAMSVRELARRVGSADDALSRRQGTPIVDASGRLVGIVTRSDLMRALAKDPEGAAGVLDAGTRSPVVGFEDELVRDAVERMLSHDIGRLPVVAREDPTRLVGYLGRAGVVAARHRLLEEERVRERGLRPVTS
ncbi:MAG TPA: chloride channel protein [Thermoanaerobaculia bacterium]|nr:chloride channel protein [Thermoanaerobaculia bacterium]